jgi:hypothetical protein
MCEIIDTGIGRRIGRHPAALHRAANNSMILHVLFTLPLQMESVFQGVAFITFAQNEPNKR